VAPVGARPLRGLRDALRDTRRGAASRLKRGSHERDGRSEIAEHKLRADADDAEARALQLAITRPRRRRWRRACCAVRSKLVPRRLALRSW